jgi:superfamily I DNA and/or RNA helicase
MKDLIFLLCYLLQIQSIVPEKGFLKQKVEINDRGSREFREQWKDKFVVAGRNEQSCVRPCSESMALNLVR